MPPRKWSKYKKNFQAHWLKEPQLKNWLVETPENQVLEGKKEASCKLCKAYLRAHHSDLLEHAKTMKHKRREKALDRIKQSPMEDHGYSCLQVTNQAKTVDLRLAMFKAMHTPVKSMDHLGELLRIVGKGSPLENLRLHRTKCSKLISMVIFPVVLEDLVKEIGDRYYCVIADESTAVDTKKFMGLCFQFFSELREKMVTEFLGLVEVTRCTGEILAGALLEYLVKIKLVPRRMSAIGTDGAANMCGNTNSFYTHLREKIPDLVLIKCVCHSLDNAAEKAFGLMPDSVDFVLRESHNWFSKSAIRNDEYQDYCKAMNNMELPYRLPGICDTRWLTWLPACMEVINQWDTLGRYFNLQAPPPPPPGVPVTKKDFKISELARLFADPDILVYLKFLKSILSEVREVSKSFEQTTADVTKLYADLRRLIFALAARIMYPQAIPQTSRPGVLRSVEVATLKKAMSIPTNFLPVDRTNLGEALKNFLPSLNPKTPDEEKRNADILEVRKKCGEYVFKLCRYLLDQLPLNLDTIEKMKYFSPHLALARMSRPSFDQLPLVLVEPGGDMDVLERQWRSLGTLTLKCLTLPVSNAVVERVFSFMEAIKSKQRNRMQLEMLSSLLRVRVHSKVIKVCCKDFLPTQEMLSRFNSQMYVTHHEDIGVDIGVDADDDLDEEDYECIAQFPEIEEIKVDLNFVR